MEDNIFENDYITLTDEDGNDIDFEMAGQCELNGETYFAVIPVEDDGEEKEFIEYVILKLANDGEEDYLVTVDDDDELDDVADYFDDLFSREIDYDN